MTTELETAMASLRSALPDDETDHGHVVIESDAIRSVLAALSTPPADDVREALIAQLRRPVWDAPGYATEAQAPMVADAVLAAFDVRPRGTVTDAEVEAAYNAMTQRRIATSPAVARHILEAAREVRS